MSIEQLLLVHGYSQRFIPIATDLNAMPEKKIEKSSSTSRVLGIIEMVSHSERPVSPADIAHYLDIPKPSVHRLLQQLERDGFLQPDIRGLWIPGARLRHLGLRTLQHAQFRAPRQAILQTLANKVGETCGLSIPMGLEMTYLDRVQTNWPLQIHLPEGSNVPIWCTASGKLYLSSLPPAQREKLVCTFPLPRMTRNTLCDPEALMQDLIVTAQRGMGLDNEEFMDGMVACSVPILDTEAKLVACLWVHAPSIRISIDELIALKPLMMEAAAELTHV